LWIKIAHDSGVQNVLSLLSVAHVSVKKGLFCILILYEMSWNKVPRHARTCIYVKVIMKDGTAHSMWHIDSFKDCVSCLYMVILDGLSSTGSGLPTTNYHQQLLDLLEISKQSIICCSL